MNSYLRGLITEALTLPLPDSGHVFDVPQVPEVPTEDDVRRATERLIELEAEAASIPDTIRRITSLSDLMSFAFDPLAPLEEYREYTAAAEAATTARDEWLDHQQLLAQQISHWQSAVAVMEHDLSWQAYTASSVRSAAKRPSLRAALAIADGSWAR